MKLLRKLTALLLGLALALVAVPRPQADATLILASDLPQSLLAAPEPIVAQLKLANGETAPYALLMAAEDFVSPLNLQPVSLETGEILTDYAPIELGMYYVHALSPDGRMLAVVTYEDNMTLNNGVLHFIDLEAWTDTIRDLEINEWIGSITWNPAGTQLAITTSSSAPVTSMVFLYDIQSEQVIAEKDLKIGDTFYPMQLRYAADGDSLILYGNLTQSYVFKAAHVMLLDGHTLETEWQAELEGVVDGMRQFMDEETDIQRFYFWQPAVVIAPDASKLYVVHADSETLTTVDFNTHSISNTAPKQTGLGRLLAATSRTAFAKVSDGISKQAVLSADGTRLYVVGAMTIMEVNEGDYKTIRTPLNLQVWDVATGEVLETYETEASSIMLSPDKQQLFLYGYADNDDPWTEVVDAETLELLQRIDQEQVIPVQLVNQSEILLASFVDYGGGVLPESRLTIMAPTSFEVLSQFVIDGYATWLSL